MITRHVLRHAGAANITCKQAPVLLVARLLLLLLLPRYACGTGPVTYPRPGSSKIPLQYQSHQRKSQHNSASKPPAQDTLVTRPQPHTRQQFRVWTLTMARVLGRAASFSSLHVAVCKGIMITQTCTDRYFYARLVHMLALAISNN